MTVTIDEQRSETADVAVVGGGAAGLSAAVVLARAGRSVLVIDAGAPRNAPADEVHSFLSRDGVRPAELIASGQRELAGYGGRLLSGWATAASRTDSGFDVSLQDGGHVAARRLLVTSGLTDDLPDVGGLRERWGKDVIHCPYCHGWEVRGQPIGVLASGPMAVHQALLFRQWTSDLVLFVHTAAHPTDDQAEQLAARGIRVVTGRVESLQLRDDRMTGVQLSDGTVVARAALVVGPRLVASSLVLEGLGLQPIAHPLGAEVGQSFAADPTGLTAVPGVWVAGNVTDVQAGVINAAAAAVNAAAAINADLIAEETEQAVSSYRAAGSVAEQKWENAS